MSETTVNVTLGNFACASIRAKLGPDLHAAAAAALTHYALKLKLGRPPLGPPKGLGEAAAEPEASLELTVDRQTHALLRAEAERQGTTLGALASHSIFVYLAELDLMAPDPPSPGPA